MILDNDFAENEKAKFTDIKAKPKEDFTGMKFGRLTVICRANDYHYPNGRDVSARWHCICDCDEHNLVDVKHSHLKYLARNPTGFRQWVVHGCWLYKKLSYQTVESRVETLR